MFPAAMSNSTSLSEEASVSSCTRVQDFGRLNQLASTIYPLQQQQQQQQQQTIKKKRSLPGNPDPDAEVIALSPKTLMATNRFVCEICNKGFQRDQNLQLHRRGHNLPWKLKQRNSKEIKKKAYVCPEPTCVHHHPSRALGDLTGIKKHYCRKHGEKKWKCEKCSKIYAVQSDWKAHSKTCGTREYRCDCGTLFSRKDSFITHRAFCDALAEESARFSAHQLIISQNSNAHALLLQNPLQTHPHSLFSTPTHQYQISFTSPWDPPRHQNPSSNNPQNTVHIKPETTGHFQIPASLLQEPPLTMPNHKGLLAPTFQSLSNASASPAASHHLSATALLQKAASVGATQTSAGHSHMTPLDMGELGSAGQVHVNSVMSHVSQGPNYNLSSLATWQKSDRLTRDFLGLTAPECGDHRGHAASNANGSSGGVNVSMDMREILNYTGGVGFHQQQYNEREHSLLKPHGGFGFAQPSASEAWGDH